MNFFMFIDLKITQISYSRFKFFFYLYILSSDYGLFFIQLPSVIKVLSIEILRRYKVLKLTRCYSGVDSLHRFSSEKYESFFHIY